MNGVESRNFGFLGQNDLLWLHCAVRAELYAFDDPNASLVKSRQLAEYLALRVAAEHGVETAGMTFNDVLRQLGTASSRVFSRTRTSFESSTLVSSGDDLETTQERDFTNIDDMMSRMGQNTGGDHA